MAKYMTLFSYTAAGMKGLVDAPSDRRIAAAKLFASAGGDIECMYYCFGEHDGVVITDFPDEVSASAALMVVGASGMFSNLQTAVLIATDDAIGAMEKAKSILGDYAPPGA